MEPGELWTERLRQEVRNADVVLLVIGPRWLTLQDAYGVRRLDDRDDWVRVEIEEALEARKTLIPMLVDGAGQLKREAFLRTIPHLAGLADLQALQLSAKPWDKTFDTLLAARSIKLGFRRNGHDSNTESQRARPDATHGSASTSPPSASYAAGPIALPFDCVTFKVLHDQVTAIVGGANGEIAAIDLRTGRVLQTAAAEDSTRAHIGGGESHYIDNAYFFLELAPASQRFYTMSHSAVLKTWAFDGVLRVLNSVSILESNTDALRTAILARHRRGDWSTWTMYSQDVPAYLGNRRGQTVG